MSHADRTPDREPRQQRLGLSWELTPAAAAPAASEAVLGPESEPELELFTAAKPMSEEPAAMNNQTPPASPEPKPLKLKLEGSAPAAVVTPEAGAPAAPARVLLTKKPAEAPPPSTGTQVVAGISAAAKDATPGTNPTVILTGRPVSPGKGKPLTPTAVEPAGNGLGARLRQAREARGLSVTQVAEDTRISSDYIAALEAEDFANLPLAAIYVKSYLKTLARRYGLSADELTKEYEALMAAPARPVEPAAAAAAPTTAEAPKQQKRKRAAAPRRKLPELHFKRYTWAMAALVAIVFAILGAAVIKSRLHSVEVRADDLTMISEQDLETYVVPERLPFSAMDIPRRESAADARQ